MSRPDDCFLDSHQLSTVKTHAARLLDEASALYVFPTPIDRLMAAAKLTVVDDDFLDEGILGQMLKAAKSTLSTVKSALSKVLALIHVTDRLVLIDKGVPSAKVPFVKLHEAGHGTLPHQKQVYSLIHDCKQTLDPDITDMFEREANVFAAEVIFQGQIFAEEAHQSAFGMGVPIALAKKFGASNYSAFRRYVDTNPSACCVLVLNPVVRGADKKFTAEVRRIIFAKSFHRLFDEAFFGSAISQSHILGHMVPVGRRMTRRRQIKLRSRDGNLRKCAAEAFNTGHQIFLLIRDEGPASTIILPPRHSSLTV